MSWPSGGTPPPSRPRTPLAAPNPKIQQYISGLAKESSAKKLECGIHEITYVAVRAGCPVCNAERDRDQLRNALQSVKGQLEILAAENVRLKAQTDVVFAIREAADLMDDNDLEFFKVALYQWRDHKSIALKTTHGSGIRSGRSKKKLAANGFIVIQRQGDPWGHSCSSIGGMAIAQYFDEATNSAGAAKAMEWLVKGLSDHLPGTS